MCRLATCMHSRKHFSCCVFPPETVNFLIFELHLDMVTMIRPTRIPIVFRSKVISFESYCPGAYTPTHAHNRPTALHTTQPLNWSVKCENGKMVRQRSRRTNVFGQKTRIHDQTTGEDGNRCYVEAPSLNCFKTRLDKFWSNQDVLYNFKAPFLGTGSRSYS